MFLHRSSWDKLAAYIFIDRKIDSSSSIYLKSRFFGICDYLEKHNLEFTKSSVNLYLQYKKDNGCKNSYLNNIIKVVKYAHDYLLENEGYDSGCSTITYFKRERHIVDILTTSECQSIYQLDYPYTREKERLNVFYKTVFMLLTLTGMRVGEAIKLKWSDISETVIRINDTKTDVGRIIPNNSKLNEQFIIHKRYFPSEWVFPAKRREGHAEVTYWKEDLKNRAKYLGIEKKVWLHLFRHSFCVEMLRNNDVTLVAKLMGHENLASTLTYSHYLIDDMTNAIYTHPLLRTEQTFEGIIERIEEYINKIIDNEKNSVHIKRERDAFSICVKRN